MEQASRSGWMATEIMRRGPGGMLAASRGAVYNCASTWSRISVHAQPCRVICAGRLARMTASYYCQLTGYHSKLPPCAWKSCLRSSFLLETHTPFVTFTHTHTHPHTLNQSSPNPSLSHHTETKRAFISDRTVGCNDNV